MGESCTRFPAAVKARLTSRYRYVHGRMQLASRDRMLIRNFTLFEFAVWYGLDRRTVRKMLRNSQLHGLRTPAGWRIPDPGPPLVERMRQQYLALEDAPFIRGVEAAELMGISSRRVRKLAEEGQLPCRMRAGRRLYALADILAVLDRRTQGRQRQPGSYARPWVMDWARKVAEKG